MSDEAFIGFRKLVSGTIIKIIYATGVFALIVVGLLTIAYPFLVDLTGMTELQTSLSPTIYILTGLLILTVGNLLWRLICEGWILLFSIHEILASIESKLKERQS